MSENCNISNMVDYRDMSTYGLFSEDQIILFIQAATEADEEASTPYT